MTKLSNLGQIAMPVRDLPRAIEFYRDRLGLPFLFQAPPALAFFQCGPVRLLAEVPADKEFQHPGSVLYFSVENIGSAYEDLLERGVTFRGVPHLITRMPDHELWMAFFDDGQGNTHALMCEKR